MKNATFVIEKNSIIMYKLNDTRTDYTPFKELTLKGRVSVSKEDYKIGKEILTLMPDSSGGHDVEKHQSLTKILEVLQHPYNKDGYIYEHLVNHPNEDIGDHILKVAIPNYEGGDIVDFIMENEMYSINPETGLVFFTMEGDHILGIVGDDIFNEVYQRVVNLIKKGYEVRKVPNNIQGNHKAWSTLLCEFNNIEDAEELAEKEHHDDDGATTYIEEVFYI